ncbi:MAG TPA: FecR family protein [Candidatus Binatia bacterium]|nr:FecR family protein [Candidatus Binatia bacterium]
MNRLKPRSVVVGLVGLLAMLAVSGLAEAQMTAATAEVVRVAGRVDVMQKGQTAWAATSLGARLREGDQIRALGGGSADLNLPDGSTVLLAENTRFAVTKLDYDAANRDREISLHLVAGKVRAQVQQAGATLIKARQSNFNISTPTGVAAVRGTILIMAHNPATLETLAFVFPSPNQAISSARATFVTPGGQVTLTGGNFVRQVGTSAPGAPTPITSLPPAVQAALTTAQNTSTANSNQLTVINVVLPSYQEIQNTISTPPIDTTTTTNTSGLTTGACPNCGQDMNSNSSTTPPSGPSCSTPPCPPVPAGSRR